MKNELQTLENIFADFIKFEDVIKTAFEKYEYRAFKIVQDMTCEEAKRIKNVLNEATQGMQQPDHIKLYISQYLVRLSNLLNRVATYKGMYDISWERKLKELKAETEYKEEDTLFTIELHQYSAINLCENEIRILTLSLVRDYEYLFDTLEQDDQVSIIINDFKKNPEGKIKHQPPQKIKWAGSAKDFVKAFNPLIKAGTLQFKGNSDVEPLVRQLYNFFEIDKSRGDGEVTFESLSTYFKKENSGEAY
ncbi:MAG TPA: hypothetical protein VMR70_11425 [Flavisolibacter sp.]|nr:hypothetical protein [Flavisolibacter sp.]